MCSFSSVRVCTSSAHVCVLLVQGDRHRLELLEVRTAAASERRGLEAEHEAQVSQMRTEAQAEARNEKARMINDVAKLAAEVGKIIQSKSKSKSNEAADEATRELISSLEDMKPTLRLLEEMGDGGE